MLLSRTTSHWHDAPSPNNEHCFTASVVVYYTLKGIGCKLTHGGHRAYFSSGAL